MPVRAAVGARFIRVGASFACFVSFAVAVFAAFTDAVFALFLAGADAVLAFSFAAADEGTRVGAFVATTGSGFDEAGAGVRTAAVLGALAEVRVGPATGAGDAAGAGATAGALATALAGAEVVHRFP